MKTKEPKYVAATLAWCNDRRKEKGLKPRSKLPKGKRYDGLSCPCGKATGWDVGVRIAHSQGLSIKVPYQVGLFVRALDTGRLPQYELNPKENL